MSTSVNEGLHNKIQGLNKREAESLTKGAFFFFWHRNILDRNSVANPAVHAGHSFQVLVPPSASLCAVRAQMFFRSCCEDHLPFCWALRGDPGVKASGWGAGTLDLLLFAGLVFDGSVGSGSAVTVLVLCRGTAAKFGVAWKTGRGQKLPASQVTASFLMSLFESQVGSHYLRTQTSLQ